MPKKTTTKPTLVKASDAKKAAEQNKKLLAKAAELARAKNEAEAIKKDREEHEEWLKNEWEWITGRISEAIRKGQKSTAIGLCSHSDERGLNSTPCCEEPAIYKHYGQWGELKNIVRELRDQGYEVSFRTTNKTCYHYYEFSTSDDSYTLYTDEMIVRWGD
jgi:hypothetical protein